MAGLLGRLRGGSKGLLTLSLEGTSLRLLRVQDGRIPAEGWMTLPFNPRLMRGGRVEDPAGLAEVVKNGLGRVGGGRGQLLAGFPGTRLTIRTVAIPRVRGVSPEVIVPREARRILGAAADQQHLFWSPLSASPLELRYFLLALPRDEMARFVETLHLSGLKPRKIDARPLALARAADVPTAVLLRLEATDLDLTIVVDRVPRLATSRALEAGLSLEDLVAEITEVVQTTVAFQTGRGEGAVLPPEAPVLLCGGHPYMDEALLRAIHAGIGREVRFPSSLLPAPEDFPAVEYMVNLGLALKPL